MSPKWISPLVLFGQCRYTTNHRKNSFYVQLWYCIATLFAPPQSKLCHEMLCLLNGFKAKSKDLLCVFNICTNICAHRPNIYKQCMHRFWIINTVSWINRYHVSGLGTCEKKYLLTIRTWYLESLSDTMALILPATSKMSLIFWCSKSRATLNQSWRATWANNWSITCSDKCINDSLDCSRGWYLYLFVFRQQKKKHEIHIKKLDKLTIFCFCKKYSCRWHLSW